MAMFQSFIAIVEDTWIVKRASSFITWLMILHACSKDTSMNQIFIDILWLLANLQVKIYRKEANYGKAMALEASAFVPSGDAFVKIMLVWGAKPRDFSECHKSDYLCTGRQVWDDVFDLNNPLSQLTLQVSMIPA